MQARKAPDRAYAIVIVFDALEEQETSRLILGFNT